MSYAVGAYKEFENKYGMILEEQVKFVDASDEVQAEKVAKDLFNKGGYSSIYISYNHPESTCYYNPIVGHNPTGDNWVKYFE